MPRIVNNLLTSSVVPPNTSSFDYTNGNATIVAVDGEYTRIESTASSVRSFWGRSMDLVAGHRYALRIDVKNVVGVISGMIQIAGAGITLLPEYVLTRASDGPVGVVFDVGVTGSVALRFGVNPAAVGGVHPMGVTMGRVQFEELPLNQSLLSEYVYPGQSMMMPTEPPPLLNGSPGYTQGLPIFYNEDDVVMVFGDSFGNGTDEWPQLLVTQLKKKKVIYSNSISGRTLETAIGQVEQQITLSPFSWNGAVDVAINNFAVRPGCVVMALGINDLVGGASLSELQSMVLSFASLNSGRRIIFFDLPPCKDALGVTGEMLTIRSQYNSWLPTIVSGVNKTLKVSDILKDTTDADKLLAAYDSGDHLHPNSTGSAAIASGVLPHIYAGFGDWVPFDSTMPTLELATAAPGKLQKVQVS